MLNAFSMIHRRGMFLIVISFPSCGKATHDTPNLGFAWRDGNGIELRCLDVCIVRLRCWKPDTQCERAHTQSGEDRPAASS
jgi:hypothetical protein